MFSFLMSFSIILIKSGCIHFDIVPETHYYEILRGSVLAVDTLINFLSLFLTFSHFCSYYAKICWCCDKKCKKWCRKLAVNEEAAHQISTHSNANSSTLEVPI